MQTTLFDVMMTVFALTAMMSLGIETERGSAMAVLERPAWLLRSLVASLVLVPSIAFGVLHFATISPGARAGILVMALAPGGASGLQYTRGAGAPAHALAAQLLMSLAGFVLTPFLVRHLIPMDAAFELPLPRVIVAMGVYLLLPLLAGRLLRRRAPRSWERIRKGLNIAATICFVVAFLVLARDAKAQAKQLVGPEAHGAMVLVIALSMLTGWLLGGGTEAHREVMMTKVSIRNAALALVIARNAFEDELVAQAVMAYAATAIPMNLLFYLGTKLGSRLAARKDRNSYTGA